MSAALNGRSEFRLRRSALSYFINNCARTLHILLTKFLGRVNCNLSGCVVVSISAPAAQNRIVASTFLKGEVACFSTSEGFGFKIIYRIVILSEVRSDATNVVECILLDIKPNKIFRLRLRLCSR